MDSTSPSPPSTSGSALSVDQLRAGVAALGHGFDDARIGATRELYRASVRARLSTDHTVALDIAYGPAERHRLDVYRGRGDKLPVVVFVHGGGFVAGNKRGDPEFYGNIGHYFAEAGFVAVVMNYRLAPADAWPSGPVDVQSALDWVKANVNDHGGDPEQVFLMGQSAGGAHVAGYLFDPDSSAHATRSLTAAILLNGLYRFKAPLSAGTLAYFGDDGTQYERRSPITHVANSRVPLMIAVSEFDPGAFVNQGYALAEAVTSRDGQSPVFLWMEGHNHVSCVLSLGSGQDDVGQALVKYLNRFKTGT